MLNPNHFRVTMIRAVLEDTWNDHELEHALLIVHRLAGEQGEALVASLEQLETKKDKKRITPAPAKLTPEQALAKRRESKAKYQAKVRAAAQPTERTCPHCDKAFTATDPRSKYCSRACGQAAWKAKQDPERFRIYSQTHRTKKGGQTPPVKAETPATNQATVPTTRFEPPVNPPPPAPTPTVQLKQPPTPEVVKALTLQKFQTRYQGKTLEDMEGSPHYVRAETYWLQCMAQATQELG